MKLHTMNLELLTKQVANLSRAIGNYLKKELKNIQLSDVVSKGTNDFVTYVDKTSENRLVAELKKLLPEAGFIVEENKELLSGKRYNWIVDPLDGTTNFIHGAPPFSISIALQDNNRIVLGVVFEANLNECFYSWEGGGAFVNGHRIFTSNAPGISQSLIATGFPYSDFSRLDDYMELLQILMKSSHGIRRLGSAAVDLAYVACGRYDIFYEYGLNAWDVAAGSILVKEAGGEISDFTGKENFIFGKELIATNKFVFNEFLQLVESKFN
jgi:myo-inositol-1(or 4)-monophosphatase